MDLQHEFAAFEFASLELAGGLLVQESQSNSIGQAGLSLSMQSVAALNLGASGAGVFLPTIQGIKFGDSDLAITGIGYSQYGACAFGDALHNVYGAGTFPGNGGAHSGADVFASGVASASIAVQALSPANYTCSGSSSLSLDFQAYGAFALSADGYAQTLATGARVHDTEHRSAGIAEASLDFAAYGATTHAMTGQSTTIYAGQCTIRSDMVASGSTTQTLTAARVFDGVYRLQAAAAFTGRFCAYGDQLVTINGLAATSYAPTNSLRYSRLAKSYDVSIRFMELRGTIKPYEARTTIKPSETRGIVHPAKPRHSPWSEA